MDVGRYMILNGELTEWQHLGGTYVYQHIHTLDYAPYHLSQHLRIIEQASNLLFDEPTKYDECEIRECIKMLLAQAHLSRKVSICITMKLYTSGDTTIEYDVPSIYSGYVLRSLRAEATCLRMDIPLEAYPTSAAEASSELAEAIARARGYHTAIVVDGNDNIRCSSSAPIAVVNGKTLLISDSTGLSVERNILEQATRKAGYTIEYRTLKRADLATADEVLRMNWQGLTAMQTVNGKPYMDIIAERIAKEFER